MVYVTQKYKQPLEKLAAKNVDISQEEIDLLLGNLEAVKNVSKSIYNMLKSGAKVGVVFSDMAPFMLACKIFFSPFLFRVYSK